MKGSVGTATSIISGPRPKQKYKAYKTFYCYKCKGWILKDQWFSFTKRGTKYHHSKEECKK